MIVISNNQVYSDEGKYVHRLGTESYFKRGTILKTDAEANFEEVDSIPVIEDESSYKEQVAQRVHEKYSIDDELAILRQKDTKPQEFEEYYNYVENVKSELKNK